MKSWMKHLLTLCAVILALSIAVPGFFGEAYATEDEWEEEYNISWSFQEEGGILTISGTGETYDYSYFAGYEPPWNDLDEQIREIVVEEGITVIGAEAFAGCINLTRVSLPTTLTTLKDSAFWECTSLQTITLPQNLAKMDYYENECRVFDDCSSLKEILVHEDNPYFTSCDGFLYNKSKTELIRCPEAFTGAYDIPEGTVKIDRGAFGYCSGLTAVRIPGTVKELGEYVFFDCTSLESADLSALTCEFFPDIFVGCTKLKGITLSGNYPYYTQDAQGALYAPDMSRLVFCCKGFTGNFAVPYGVKEIGGGAFEGCMGLKSAVLPETVERIGYSAFKDCSTLERVTIPNGVKLIDSYAFELCSALESVKIPGSVEAIEAGAFRYCMALRSLSMEYGLKVIGYDAFEHCEALTSVAIPDSVTLLDEKAFEGCIALSSVILPGNSLEEIGINIFLDCDNLRNVYFRGKAPTAEELEENWCLWNRNVVTLYYLEGREGWTSPSLAEFLTAKWSGNVATDVVDTDYFYTPVYWAMENGITNGVGKDLFRPENTCTRGQIVTFLWRDAGCPEPETKDAPFTDISAEDYYYKAVLWAVEQGITNGVSYDRFSPEGICTRSQVATFLWRAAGEPAPASQTVSFTDVPDGTYYTQAVQWAVEQGITAGVGKNRFSPEGLCTRGQIVTFLWRWAGEPKASADLSPYCTVIRGLMEEPGADDSNREGTLGDLDGDGTEELFLMYTNGEGPMLCDVYTIRDGEAHALLKGEQVVATGTDLAECGIVQVQGKLYFYTFGLNYLTEEREGYEAAYRDIYSWKRYSFENGDLSLETEGECNYVYGCNEEGWPVLLESSVTIDRESVSYEIFEAWRDAMIYLRNIDGDAQLYGPCVGYSLQELLLLCQ